MPSILAPDVSGPGGGVTHFGPGVAVAFGLGGAADGVAVTVGPGVTVPRTVPSPGVGVGVGDGAIFGIKVHSLYGSEVVPHGETEVMSIS